MKPNQEWKVVALTALLTFIAFKPAFAIDLGPVDDHEIVRFLGRNKRLLPWELIQIYFTETEIAKYGTYGRFRPTYYFLRLIEIGMHGIEASRWVFTRIVIVATSLVLLAFVLTCSFRRFREFDKTVMITVWTFSILSLPHWPDLVMRLGPSEIYLLLFFSLALFFLARIASNGVSDFDVNAFLLSVIGAIGSKENSAFFLVVLMILLVSQVIVRRRFGTFPLPKIVFTLLIGTAILGGPAIYSIRSGSDIYGTPRSVSSIMSTSLSIVFSRAGAIFVTFLMVCTLTWVLLRGRGKISHRDLVVRVLLFSFFGMVILSERIFYQQSFSEPRYEILTRISHLSLVALCVLTIFELWGIVAKRHWALRLVTIGVLIALLIPFGRGYLEATDYLAVEAQKKASISGQFQKNIRSIVTELESNRYSAILIRVTNVWHYEPAYAISQYLNFYGGTRSIYLSVEIEIVQPGLESTLLTELNQISARGNRVWGITEITSQPTEDLLCVSLGQLGAPDSRCLSTLFS